MAFPVITGACFVTIHSNPAYTALQAMPIAKVACGALAMLAGAYPFAIWTKFSGAMRHSDRYENGTKQEESKSHPRDQ